MAVTSKNLNSAQRAVQVQTKRRPQSEQLHVGMYLLTLMLASIAIYAIMSVVVSRVNLTIDDIRYGRPRTSRIEAYVQHGDAPGKPTYLMAVNLNRQVSVIEIPGGDPAQTRSFAGPYLFGADEDLTPVTLSIKDMDGDGLPDLLVDVRREQIVYLNRDGTFRLPTADERATLQAGQQ